jgi:hypothetical protein
MLRLALVACAIVTWAASATASAHVVTRAPVTADVWQYTFTVPVGDGPNARLAIHRVTRERAPWRPRATPHAMLFVHGDFGNFSGTFAGIARFLALSGIDVWGVDARWTQAPRGPADTSDFAAMTAAQRVDDTLLALAFARATRLATGAGLEKVTLAGFSSGGHFAYLVASRDAARPAWQRHVKALVPIDSPAAVDPAVPGAVENACIGRDLSQADFDAGLVDFSQEGTILLGELALSDPDGPSPNPRFTNLGRMRNFVGRTWLFFFATPWYHLAAGVIVANTVTALRESSDAAIATWLAAASPHQAWRESLDLAILLCGEPPLPIDAPLARITVPVFYLGAAGGWAEDALYTTTQLGSTDVTTLIVRRFGPEQASEDFGHADLLFAADAPALAWAPLAAWVRAN